MLPNRFMDNTVNIVSNKLQVGTKVASFEMKYLVFSFFFFKIVLEM